MVCRYCADLFYSYYVTLEHAQSEDNHVLSPMADFEYLDLFQDMVAAVKERKC